MKLIAPTLILTITVVAAGCQSFPNEKPVWSGALRGNYVAIADCSFLKLQREFPDITRTEIPSAKTVQIARGSLDIIYWRADISDAGDGRSQLTFRSARAAWGETFYLDQVMPLVRSCTTE